MRRSLPQPTQRQRRQAEVLGIGASTLRVRLHRGWPVVDAVTTPPRYRSDDGDRQAYFRTRSRAAKFARMFRAATRDKAADAILAKHGLQ